MKGTDKQIAWAEEIKSDALNTLDANIKRTEKLQFLREDNEAYRLLKAMTVKALGSIEEAGTLIERRNAFAPRSLTSTAATWANNIRSGRITAEEIAKKIGVETW